MTDARRAARWLAAPITMIVVAFGAWTPPLTSVAVAADVGASHCSDSTAAPSVEEARLARSLKPGQPPAGPQLIKLAGFDSLVSGFAQRLCGTKNLAQATKLADVRGAELWDTAVARAQGKRPGLGTIDRYDDRPLYWARLTMTKAVRQWNPPFTLTSAQRTELIKRLDYAARGITTVNYPRQGGPKHAPRKIMISGFDPFFLDGTGLVRANPSGASALQLDGRVFNTSNGKVAVQAVSFPVLWGAFDKGIVEAAYGPRLKGRDRVDTIITVSQGGGDDFPIERWAARWRGGGGDNYNVRETGSTPAAAGWPQPTDEFIETTLPERQMREAKTGPFPVFLNCGFTDSVVDNPSDSCDVTPTKGAQARAGGGGDYLSNESMYRANRLRVGLGVDIPGGHLHTPYLDPLPAVDGPENAKVAAKRDSIANQTVQLVQAAGAAIPPAPGKTST